MSAGMLIFAIIYVWLKKPWYRKEEHFAWWEWPLGAVFGFCLAWLTTP